MPEAAESATDSRLPAHRGLYYGGGWHASAAGRVDTATAFGAGSVRSAMTGMSARVSRRRMTTSTFEPGIQFAAALCAPR